jgi:exosortase K
VVKTKLCVLVGATLIAWGLKHHYAVVGADELWWILTPIARTVGVATGTAFQSIPGEGYVSRERLFVIEKSCAGVNFMIAAFAMMVFTFYHRISSGISGAYVLVVSLVASYGAAVFVNAIRITMAIWLAAHSLAASGLSAAEVHRLEGIGVYFAGLVVLYEIAFRLDRGVVTAKVRS